jgi:maltooligosyltrehalose trehalohydrolase
MGWDPASVPDPQDPETFRRSKLDWSEPARQPHAALLDLHRRLAELRRRLPELTDPRFLETEVDVDAAAEVLVLHRGRTTVAANLGTAEALVEVQGSVVLSTGGGIAVVDGTLTLPAETAAIVVA